MLIKLVEKKRLRDTFLFYVINVEPTDIKKCLLFYCQMHEKVLVLHPNTNTQVSWAMLMHLSIASWLPQVLT